MHPYLSLMDEIITDGVDRGDRTGTGTRSKFGHLMRYDLNKGFPIVTTKRVFFKGVKKELLWFLDGSTNIKPLTDEGVNIWNEWATEDGAIGNMYGAQWVDWNDTRVVTLDRWTERQADLMRDGYRLVAEDKERGLITINRSINQIAKVIEDLKERPESRRIIFTAWNPSELPNDNLSPQENVKAGKMALAPCHAFVQLYVADGRLSLLIVQRSVDTMLGLPFNIASYALLCHMIAQQCDLGVQDLVWVGGDCHVYHNHFEQVKTQLERTPGALPTLNIKRKPDSIFDYQMDDFELIGYEPQAHIAAPIAV